MCKIIHIKKTIQKYQANKYLDTIDNIKSTKLLPIKSKRALMKSINDYYDNKDVYNNELEDRFRARSMQKLLNDKGRTLSHQKFSIPGIFGMPKIFNHVILK